MNSQVPVLILVPWLNWVNNLQIYVHIQNKDFLIGFEVCFFHYHSEFDKTYILCGVLFIEFVYQYHFFFPGKFLGTKGDFKLSNTKD